MMGFISFGRTCSTKSRIAKIISALDSTSRKFCTITSSCISGQICYRCWNISNSPVPPSTVYGVSIPFAFLQLLVVLLVLTVRVAYQAHLKSFLIDHPLPSAIHKIRQLPKPLSAYFFSENDKAISYFLEELPFGGGCINDVITHVGNMHLPFGGVGPSGVKSYHGKASFENFTHPKSVLKRSIQRKLKVLGLG